MITATTDSHHLFPGCFQDHGVACQSPTLGAWGSASSPATSCSQLICVDGRAILGAKWQSAGFKLPGNLRFLFLPIMPGWVLKADSGLAGSLHYSSVSPGPGQTWCQLVVAQPGHYRPSRSFTSTILNRRPIGIGSQSLKWSDQVWHF